MSSIIRGMIPTISWLFSNPCECVCVCVSVCVCVCADLTLALSSHKNNGYRNYHTSFMHQQFTHTPQSAYCTDMAVLTTCKYSTSLRGVHVCTNTHLHCMCLPTRCLTVCKNGSIVSCQNICVCVCVCVCALVPISRSGQWSVVGRAQ